MFFLVPPSRICFLCWEVAFLSWTFNICRNVQTLHQWLCTNSLKIQKFYMCFSEGSAFFYLVSAVCSPLGRFHAQNRASLAAAPSEFGEMRLSCVLWKWKGGFIFCFFRWKNHFLISVCAKSRSALGLKYECCGTSFLRLLTILPGPRKPKFDYLFCINYHEIICKKKKEIVDEIATLTFKGS